jgi:tetratricopeptide (TPR) repeat protein
LRRLGTPRARDICAIEWIRQIAEALGHAHNYGVLHRDVKPANIIVDRAGRAHLIDFGVAWTEDADLMTLTGAVLGTPRYMSPEAIRGRRTAQGDVYSLGVVALESLTGRVPYDGRTAAEVEAARDQGPAPTLRILRPDLRSAAHWVLGKALSPFATERYATGELMAGDLSALVEGRPTAARGPTLSASWRAFGARRPGLARMLMAGGVVALVACAAMTTRSLIGRAENERARAEEASRIARASDSIVRATLGQLRRDSPVETWRLEAQSVATLGRLASRATAETVGGALKDATRELRLARRSVYDRATNVAGLSAALDEIDRLRPGAPPTPATGAVLAEAERQLALAGVQDVRAAVLDAENRAGTGFTTIVASVCSEALGRIGVADLAVEPLVDYLAVEEDEDRAALAGTSLIQLSQASPDPRVARWIGAVARKFGHGGTFRSQVALYYPAVGALDAEDETPLTSLTPSFGGRQVQGEIPDSSGAVLLNPQIQDSWLGLGLARDSRLVVGDRLDGARRTVESAPKSASAWKQLGIAEIGARDLARSVCWLLRAHELTPTDGTILVERGQARRVLGDVFGAADDLERAVPLLPEPRVRAGALCALAVARIDAGDPKAAIRACDEALRTDPECVQSYAYRAVSKLIAGDPSGAVDDSLAALKSNGTNAEVWHCLGCARLAQGDVSGAADAANNANVASDPYVLGWNGRGVALLFASDRERGAGRPDVADRLLDESIRAFTKAIERDGHMPFAWINRGIARTRRGPSEEAVVDCTEAISRLRRLPHGYLARAIALARLCRNREAADDADVFLALAPNHPACAVAETIRSHRTDAQSPRR